VKERGPQLEVFFSNLLKLAQHLFYGPYEPELLISLPSFLRNVTKQPRGVDRIEVFEQIEVGWDLVSR
jgi:hypothetical protein